MLILTRLIAWIFVCKYKLSTEQLNMLSRIYVGFRRTSIRIVGNNKLLLSRNRCRLFSNQKLIENHGMITCRTIISIKEAASVMTKANIGALIVVDASNALSMCGIVTERDCMRAISNGLDINKDTVNSIMTSSSQTIITASISSSPNDCFHLMLSNNIRHLPVINDQGDICRVLSIKDCAAASVNANKQKADEKEAEADYWQYQAFAGGDSPGSYMSH